MIKFWSSAPTNDIDMRIQIHKMYMGGIYVYILGRANYIEFESQDFLKKLIILKWT
jgi:hypothetical protein